MKTLAIILSSIRMFNGSIPYLPSSFIEAKKRLNSRFFAFSQRLKALDDEALYLVLKPLILKISTGMMILATLVRYSWGENDKDSIELSVMMFCMALFWALALIPNKEFARRWKVLYSYLILIARWFFYIAIGTILLGIALRFLQGPPPTIEELLMIVALIVGSTIVLWILYGAAMFLFLVGIPFLTQKGFTYCIRKLINFIIRKECTDPIGLILLIIWFPFFLIGVLTYFLEKLNH